MTKKRLLIWGGNKQELSIDNLDSHASVSAYFLSKYLAREYDVVNLVDMHRPEELLEHTDVDFMLTTFQYGFTSRLIQKDNVALFEEIREKFKGPMAAVVDYVSAQPYHEDILFTVLPAPSELKLKLLRFRFKNSALRIVRMGWSADHTECRPEDCDTVNIFIDHGAYDEGTTDFSREYFLAFKSLPDLENKNVRLFRQGEDGIESWDTSSDPEINVYDRSKKIPWLTMIEHYRQTSIFCVTHHESAGLAVIEAAMSGATIYIPEYKRHSFISQELIKDGISHRLIKMSGNSEKNVAGIADALNEDLALGLKRREAHKRLSKSNSWELAAKRIHETFSQY